MGILWARAGCAVLIMDMLGHGERRQHPFVDARSFPQPFRVGRQDYYFRYNVGLQLHLSGDSLMGWMVWDLMRGVDLLLSRPGIDRERIILLGAVAGGGDPAAVTAALDPRITCVAPFNFGGPQPETVYPLPADPEERFAYAGRGSWESTRNLRASARDGFLPWVIVGAVAPRRLIYSHEFAWDRDRDPVWARLQAIYRLYDVPERLAEVHGRGRVSGKPPEATHCTNIGPLHRQGIHDALKRWFDITAAESQPGARRPADELTCLTPAVVRELHPRPMHELARALGSQQAEAVRRRLANLAAISPRQQLHGDWAWVLGDVEPPGAMKLSVHGKERLGDVGVERIALEVEAGSIVVPVLLLLPHRAPEGRRPIVVAFAQEGKQAFLKEHSEVLARLLRGGVAVALPDLRGTGETRPADAGRGRTSAATALASSAQMLGQTLLGARLRDLRAVLAHLRSRRDVDPNRVALWGSSFARSNPPARDLAVPLDAEPFPDLAEPLGGVLALFAALYEDRLRAVHSQGGLVSFQSLLDSPFCYVPGDVLVPGALTAGDLADVVAAVAPLPVRLDGLVDGRNRRVSKEELARTFAQARAAYRPHPERLRIEGGAPSPQETAEWLLRQLLHEAQP
jgi:cephalosporin-C deacetylase-like acetyl esterase